VARRAPPRRRRGLSDLQARVLVALPAAVFALVIVAEGGWVLAVGLLALGAVCLHELFGLYADLRPARLGGLLALAGLVVAARLGGPEQVLLALVASVPVLFAVGRAQVDPPGTDGLAVTLLGVVWVGLGLAHAVMLRDLPHGGGIVIDVLVGTVVGDAGAYFAGRTFGRRALAPGISPNKTVEGLAFGVVAAILGVWFAGLFQDWLGSWQALVLGVGVGVAAPVGDLFESAVKRDAGAKDTGRLFGAHGGALDRLDAILFAAVVGYWTWRALL
jgi:phosphatidate cytidylyltransferase